ncbi:MAG: RNA methyltransferase [Bacteroidales bacterium]|nr:RNA methyltransferase [Bacteroidales bacterium]
MPEIITSLQNNRIKQVVRLQKHNERMKQNLFVIEGAREISMALKYGYVVQSLFMCPSLPGFYDKILKNLPSTIQLIEVTPAVFDKMAYREQSDGLLALAVPHKIELEDVQVNTNPLIIVLETVEKPGNLGAILRTADAASATAVLICDPKTDIYNPNVIRSSLGCIFSNQVVTCTSEQALSFFKKQGIATFAACLQTNTHYHHADLSIPMALVMGTEATGLSDFWLNNSTHRIKIPMLGTVDSLNVSASTAIILFEALRQRNFNQAQKG